MNFSILTRSCKHSGTGAKLSCAQAAEHKINFLTAFFVCCLLVFNAAPAAADLSAATIRQYQIKAVYLYNFLNFVSWPTARTTADNSASQPRPYTIGVLGTSPLNRELINLAKRLRSKNQQKLRVIFYGSKDYDPQIKKCDILFFNKSTIKKFKKIIEGLKKAPVLTVSDSRDFIAAGGMISIFEVQDRIRYSINRQALTAAGLQPKSQLLNSAIR